MATLAGKARVWADAHWAREAGDDFSLVPELIAKKYDGPAHRGPAASLQATVQDLV